jgi:hypothetical protein
MGAPEWVSRCAPLSPGGPGDTATVLILQGSGPPDGNTIRHSSRNASGGATARSSAEDASSHPGAAPPALRSGLGRLTKPGLILRTDSQRTVSQRVTSLPAGLRGFSCSAASFCA